MKYTFYSLFVVAIFWSCKTTSPATPEEHDLLDGPMEELSSQEKLQFLQGDQAFGEIFTAQKGLGPIFVANSCASCHAGDGKGTPFVQFTRFGQADTTGNTFLHLGAPQLQHKAIPGYHPETLPKGVQRTNLIAPAVTGLGFLDAVSDQDLIDLSDPNDANNDGISGRPHYVNIPDFVTLRSNSISKNGRYIARFGKKGAAYDLLQQTAGAYNEDMGITSSFAPIDAWSGQIIDPEISNQEVHNVVHYLKTLKAPIQRNADEVSEGKVLFSQIQCAACHIPQLKTSFSPIDALSFKTFAPYTDLLLHDMGADLDDGYTEGYATTPEWKTPPLWGLGLSKDAQGGSYHLLHDGRATSIEEAILYHGGEAEISKNKFKALSQTEKDQLIKFLESL